MRVLLSVEDSKRVREIMSKRTIHFKHRIWDFAPFILLAVLVLQIIQSGLGVYTVWQANGADQTCKDELKQSIQTLQAKVALRPTPTTAPLTLNTQSGSIAMKGGQSVAFSTLRAQDPKAILGVDVSHYQGHIDWYRLKTAGVRFAYIKATEGSHYVDKAFGENWQGAKDAGIARGAYHVFTTSSNVDDQISNFQNAIAAAGEKGELPSALDLEVSFVSKEDVNAAKNDVTKWLQTVQKDEKKPPVVYGSLSLFNNYFAGTSLSKMPVWLAEYSTGPYTGGSKWPKWAIWQFSDKVTVDGVDGYVDVNRVRSLP
jgi:lysozyme